MTIPVRIRQPLVVLGVVLSLFGGMATIRAAAAWTAASAPLTAKPASVESLQSALQAEQARSATLQTQLDELAAGSSDLTTALEDAKNRIATDATQAGDLQARLKAAKKKLAVLEQSIRQAQSTTGRSSGAAATARPAATPPPHEGGGDD